MGIIGRYVLELICDNTDCPHTHYSDGSLTVHGHKTTIEAEDRVAALKRARESGWKLSSYARCPVCKGLKPGR